jgi:cell wall-associated NlpC family hydrolase
MPPAPRRRAPGPEFLIRSRRRQATLLLTVAAAALGLVTVAGAEPSSITTKREQAQRVLAQVQLIDAELDHAVDAYNAAQIRLDQIKAEQRVNTRRLELAKTNYARAEKTLSERLVALYTSDDQTTVEILLGATSIDDLLERVDTVQRVSAQDARVIGEVREFRGEMRERREKLARARTEQASVVEERAARRGAIESKLQEREALLATIKDELARLEAEERARQERLAAEARRRLAAQQAQADAAEASTLVETGDPAAIGPAPAARYGGVVGAAMQFLGVPYVWGGASPSGFDCSGLVMYAYAQVGVSLPHNAAMQYGYGSPVSREELAPGDIVFFNGLGHNGIYIGAGQFVHSPHTGDVVKISSLSDSWYASTYVGARRL